MKDKEKKEEKSEELDSVKTQLAKKDEEIAKAKSDCEHWKNDYYRVYADMANLRKETIKMLLNTVLKVSLIN